MKFKLMAALGVAVLAAACAGSNSDGAARRQNEAPIRALMSADALMFVSWDTDGDLRTTTAEIDAGLNREFARADVNSDGSLQPIEFQTWGTNVLGGGYLGPFRLDFDRNVDNIITRQEFDTEIRARVDAYDEEDDGVLVRSDFVRRIGQVRPPREQRVYGQPGGG